MNQSESNFIGSYENMLQCYDSWGNSLVEDIKDLSNESTYSDFRELSDGIDNYVAMYSLTNKKPSLLASNPVQIKSVFRRKVESLSGKSKFYDFVKKLEISGEHMRNFK